MQLAQRRKLLPGWLRLGTAVVATLVILILACDEPRRRVAARDAESESDTKDRLRQPVKDQGTAGEEKAIRLAKEARTLFYEQFVPGRIVPANVKPDPATLTNESQIKASLSLMKGV